jgi:hypothetical protein
LPQPARASTGPVIPPLAPPQPSWKQEVKETQPDRPEAPVPEKEPGTGSNEPPSGGAAK